MSIIARISVPPELRDRPIHGFWMDMSAAYVCLEFIDEDGQIQSRTCSIEKIGEVSRPEAKPIERPMVFGQPVSEHPRRQGETYDDWIDRIEMEMA